MFFKLLRAISKSDLKLLYRGAQKTFINSFIVIGKGNRKKTPEVNAQHEGSVITVDHSGNIVIGDKSWIEDS
jgi:hypothetical protein